MTTIKELTECGIEPILGVTPHTFSAGEPHLNVASAAPLEGAHVVVTTRSGDLGELGTALVYADAARRLGASTLTLYLPYLPAARQDRGVPFTAAVAADIINVGRFDRVVAVDPHSEVMPGLIERFERLDAASLVPGSLLDPGPGRSACIIAPDAGATDRARRVAMAHGLPLVQALKRRDPANQYKVAGYECDPIEADVAIVIDDICDGGGTFLALADTTGLPPERLRLWTTHGIYSRGIATVKTRYSVVATTDSLPSSTFADLVVPLESALVAHLNHEFATHR